jgi:hypothetical protein
VIKAVLLPGTKLIAQGESKVVTAATLNGRSPLSAPFAGDEEEAPQPAISSDRAIKAERDFMVAILKAVCGTTAFL